jgi:Gpi18-like mannosyltransferase
LQKLERSDFLFGFFASFAFLLRLYLAPHIASVDTVNWRNDVYQMMVKGRFFNFYQFTNYTCPPIWSWFIVLSYILHPMPYYFYYHDETFLTLIKLPMIISDLVIGFLIYRIISAQRFSKNKGLLASMAWLFNPHVIYIGSMWGMFDSLCIVFIVASLYLLTKEEFLPSALMLGLAISTKQYAIFVIPFLALTVFKKYDLKKGLTIFFVPFIVLAFISVPYLIYNGKAYITRVLCGVGEQQDQISVVYCGTFWYIIENLFQNNVPDFLIQYQYPILFGLYGIFLTIFYLTLRHTQKIDDMILNNSILIPTLIFLIFTPLVQKQFYVLFIPFAIIAIFYRRFKPLWYAITILPFHSFFSEIARYRIWVDRAEAVLWQMMVRLNDMFSTPICENLRLIRFVLFFALSALLISSYIECKEVGLNFRIGVGRPPTPSRPIQSTELPE